MAGPQDPFGWVGATADGKYRVEECVGEGGFAVVYRANHLGFGEKVAFKCLRVPPELQGAERDRFFDSFLHEGKLQHRLSRMTAGIAQALDVGAAVSPNGTWTPYLVLEWLQGKSLEADMEQRHELGMRGRPLHEAIALLDPVARALELAHEQNVAHRDVKPANLFLAEIGGRQTIRVLDFGIAKVITENVSVTRAFESTGRALQAFTAHYGAPEQFARRFGATGPWTDVFALALVFIELVSGKRALEGEDAAELFVSAADTQHRPTLRARGVECPDEIENVLLVALAVDPRERFRTMGEFWDALLEAAGLPTRAPFSSGHLIALSTRDLAAAEKAVDRLVESKPPPGPVPDASTQLSSSTQVPLESAASKPKSVAKASPRPRLVAALGAVVALGLAGGAFAVWKSKSAVGPTASSGSSDARAIEARSSEPAAPAPDRSSAPARSEPSADAAPAEAAPTQAPPPAVTAPAKLLAIPRTVPAGIVPRSAFWVEEFRLQPLPDDSGRTLLEAQVKCAEAGLSLCTESQWARACKEDPRTGREASWTLTGHSDGFIVRGGGSCALRAVTAGSSISADRRGLCCERSVAVESTNTNKTFLMATAAKLEEVEAAINSRKATRFLALLSDRASIDGVSRSLADLSKLFDEAHTRHPDQWSVIDVCSLGMQTSRGGRQRTVVKKRRGPESSSWSAECEVLRHRGGEISVVTLSYVFGGSGKIQSIEEIKASRDWAKP